MIDTFLVGKNASQKTKITVKSLLFVGFAILAVLLPQIAHIAIGGDSGVRFLPMYFPVLLGGMILGFKTGVFLGIASPVLSFLITSAFGNPMPALVRLPYMIAELTVYAAVSGAFSKLVAKRGLWAFPAVLAAEISGRSLFLLSAFIFEKISPISFSFAFSQVLTGIIGIIVQTITVPLIVIALREILLSRNNGNEND